MLLLQTGIHGANICILDAQLKGLNNTWLMVAVAHRLGAGQDCTMAMELSLVTALHAFSWLLDAEQARTAWHTSAFDLTFLQQLQCALITVPSEAEYQRYPFQTPLQQSRKIALSLSHIGIRTSPDCTALIARASTKCPFMIAVQ